MKGVTGPVILQDSSLRKNTPSEVRFRSSESKRLLEVFPIGGKSRVTVNVFLDKKRLKGESGE